MSELTTYNRALGILGCRKIASLAEDREPTRVLTSVWATVRDYCLEQAIWIFALRTAAAAGAALPATLNYGFPYAFTRPSDCVHTYMLSTSVSFAPPLQEVVEADGLYFARATPLYVRYSSNNALFGIDTARWTWAFSEYVAHYLAATVCYRLTRNLDLAKALYELSSKLLMDARVKDAVTATIGPLQYNVRMRREFEAGDNPMEPHPFTLVPASSEG